MLIPSIFLSFTNLHLPDCGLLFSLPFEVTLFEKNCLIEGFFFTAGSSSGSTSSNSTLTPFSSRMVSAVFQLNRTMEGKPKKESKLSRRNFLVTASPGYPEPHSLDICKPSCFSAKVQSRRHLSRATLAQIDAAETPIKNKIEIFNLKSSWNPSLIICAKCFHEFFSQLDFFTLR